MAAEGGADARDHVRAAQQRLGERVRVGIIQTDHLQARASLVGIVEEAQVVVHDRAVHRRRGEVDDLDVRLPQGEEEKQQPLLVAEGAGDPAQLILGKRQRGKDHQGALVRFEYAQTRLPLPEWDVSDHVRS
ncbi:hypothetical protein GCM10018952_65250 [Streptosporangium vulgare]